jgi:UDP-N-acetylglucosamine 2-epimerase (non-hydrolysing)
MTNRLCFVVGARPNFMKAAPVYQALENLVSGIDLLLVHTGQHYDDEMSAVFVQDLGLPEPDVFLGVGAGTHGEQTAKALVRVEQVLLEHHPELVVVAGDVNSTLAAALAAAKLQIPVAHIESGLRSFDETMPEESNRRLTDHLSRILFAHSKGAVENLAREGIPRSRVHLVGNTMIDSVFRHRAPALAREPWSRFGLEPERFALVTLHRPALVDDLDLFRRTVEALLDVGARLPVVFPVHPRTRPQFSASGFDPQRLRDQGLVVCSPLSYLDFLALEAKAAFVLTDSGGIQEETSALGVRCFTLRDTTERPVTVELGTNTILGLDPDRIRSIPQMTEAAPPHIQIPLWDGQAGPRAAQVIADFLVAEALHDRRPTPSAGRRAAMN